MPMSEPPRPRQVPLGDVRTHIEWDRKLGFYLALCIGLQHHEIGKPYLYSYQSIDCTQSGSVDWEQFTISTHTHTE